MDRLTYIVDIDGTICNFTDGKYDQCVPYEDRIEKINNLHDNGNVIIYCTARGMGSTQGNQAEAIKKYYDYTLKQLSAWGCKFDKLYLGKPQGDLYIDDRAISDTEFFKNKD